MDQGRTMQRPGGRSARVRAAVHSAVLELIETHPWEELSVPLVADASGVHQATIYRRWGTMAALLTDVVTEWSATAAALPDTGSLRDDLHVHAAAVARSLRDGNVPLILRAVIMEIRPGEQRQISPAYLERTQQLQAMLDRSAERGEPAPTLDELLELVIAPLYFYALFAEPLAEEAAVRLVDRLLDLVAQRAPASPRSAGSEPAEASDSAVRSS